MILDGIDNCFFLLVFRLCHVLLMLHCVVVGVVAVLLLLLLLLLLVSYMLGRTSRGGHYSLASPQFSTVCWHVSIINYGFPSPCWSLLMRQGSLRRASPKAGANAGGPARAAGWAADEHRLSHRAGLAGEMAGSSLAASKSVWGESGVS